MLQIIILPKLSDIDSNLELIYNIDRHSEFRQFYLYTSPLSKFQIFII